MKRIFMIVALSAAALFMGACATKKSDCCGSCKGSAKACCGTCGGAHTH